MNGRRMNQIMNNLQHEIHTLHNFGLRSAEKYPYHTLTTVGFDAVKCHKITIGGYVVQAVDYPYYSGRLYVQNWGYGTTPKLAYKALCRKLRMKN